MRPPQLRAEAADIEAAITRLGTPDGPAGRQPREQLEQRVIRLCDAAQALAPAEARAFAETLARLVQSLDDAAARLRSAGAGPGDSGPPAADHRRAAAAYGSGAGRRRGGF